MADDGRHCLVEADEINCSGCGCGCGSAARGRFSIYSDTICSIECHDTASMMVQSALSLQHSSQKLILGINRYQKCIK